MVMYTNWYSPYENLEINEKLFKYKFSTSRLEERRNHQMKFQRYWQYNTRRLDDGSLEIKCEPIDFKYFDKIKPIEYYLKDGQFV